MGRDSTFGAGMTGTYKPTCALCWNEGIRNYTYAGTYGLCTAHLKHWSVTGTYREETVTGTYFLPEWLRGYVAFHTNEERKMYNYEIPLSYLLK